MEDPVEGTRADGEAATDRLQQTDGGGGVSGSKPTAGYAVEIVGVRTQGSDLIVEVARREPGRGTLAAQILTEPFHLVSVPMRDGPVRFVEAAAK